MLAAITYQARDALSDRKVPYPVAYGPERMGQTSLADSHIVIERDRQQGDSVEAAPVQMRNPGLKMVRPIGAVARVFARSNIDGAGPEHHERIADKIVDQLLIVLNDIVIARRTRMRILASKLLSAQELEELQLQTWAGVVYELRFQVDRGVLDQDYQDEAADEAEMGGTPGIGKVATTLDTSGSAGVSTDLPSATTRID